MLADHITYISVVLGAFVTLGTLVLIFVYLLSEVLPIFSPPEINLIQRQQIVAGDPVIAMGFSRNNHFIYEITNNKTIHLYDLTNPQLAAKKIPLLLPKAFQQQPLQQSSVDELTFLTINDAGFGLITALEFKDSIEVNYPYGKNPLPLLDQDEAFTKVVFAANNERLSFFGVTTKQQLALVSFTRNNSLLVANTPWQRTVHYVTSPVNTIDNLLISPDQSRGFIQSGDQIIIIDLLNNNLPTKYEFQGNDHQAQVVDIQLLAGASSLLILNSTGSVSQWFESNNDEGTYFNYVRTFATPYLGSQQLITEKNSKGFYLLNNQQQLTHFYTTNARQTLTEQLSISSAHSLTTNNDGSLFVIRTDNELNLFMVNNPHPEVSWQTIWGKIWYEGYPEPDYVWQSSSADNIFEPKFSLVPLISGTLKSAAYTLLFSVPIALCAAIYTAYFMPSRLRKVVKPTIEMMEALPTVIIGFLAGLWLAPIIDFYLFSVIFLVILLPIIVVGFGLFWENFELNIETKIIEINHSLLLIPVIILLTYFIFKVGPHVEYFIFKQSLQDYLYKEWEISFEQRNALVVGVAMGFAVIPTIFSITEEAVFNVPDNLTRGAAALGATKWQILTSIVLLIASPGIFSAVMMGLGRAVGETMIVLMATGNTPVLDWNIFDGMRTLSANIAIEMPESEVGSSHYRILFLSAFVLFIFTFIVNSLAEFIRQRLKQKYRTL